ncbi:Uncharacterized protein OBRU01_07683, partial [Operophtera brumata]
MVQGRSGNIRSSLFAYPRVANRRRPC